MTGLHDLTGRAGATEIAYTDPAFPDRVLTLYAAVPAGFTPRTPVLFTHHGRSRNGRDYRDFLLDAADTLDLLVIAPEFTDAAFPGQPWYNSGNLRDAEGHPNPPELCTYAIVGRLFAALRAGGITTRTRYGLFGHSAGSQFTHRQITFGYRDRVAAAVAANAGTYTMPDLETAFPYGLGGTGIDAAGLAAILQFPLTVMAGTADNNPQEPFFPNDPGSMRQGPTRYQRAHNYIAAGHAAAARLGVACAWTIIDVPGVAHDGRRMSEAAAPVLAEALHADAEG